MAMEHVAVVGAGRMGMEIAFEFSLHGHGVSLLTRDSDRAYLRLDELIARLTFLGLADRWDLDQARAGLRMVSVAAELENPSLVIESLPEDLELKSTVLSHIADSVRDCTIASNTSSLSVSELGRLVGHPERTLGAHYWNPPLLMPLVEITPGDQTDPDRVESLRQTIESIGKTTVLVRRDIPGFLWNRLQFALLREALHLVATGAASVSDIDLVTQLGLARRWQHVGLFASIELGGVETWKRVAENLFPLLSTATTPYDLTTVTGLLDTGSLEEAAATRDKALATHLPEAGPDLSAARKRKNHG